jgi:hypothetical protein
MKNDQVFRKSSYSGQGANCVEVMALPHSAAVRDSKDSGGPVLRFTVAEWRAFIGAIKDGSL